jgi:hypothetical protein
MSVLQAMKIQNGGWNITRNKFKEPMPLVAWAVVDYTRTPNKAESFIKMLLNCFDVLGEFAYHPAGYFI